MLTIKLHPGIVFTDTVSAALLNQLFALGYATVESGTIETANIGDAQITVAKLAEALDLSGKTITLPATVSMNSVTFGPPKLGLVVADDTPDFAGQVGITAAGGLYLATGTTKAAWTAVAKDYATSIATKPDRISQFAFVDDKVYVANGTDSVDNWIAVNPDKLTLTQLDADPDQPATDIGFLYVKGGSLWFESKTIAPINISATVTGSMADANSPDFDSGWTYVQPAKIYDISSTSFGSVGGSDATGAGGFSRTDEDKDNDTLGTTKANTAYSLVCTPSDDRPGYRQLLIQVKRPNNGVTTYQNYIVWNGYTSSTAYHLELYWDTAAGTMKLRTGATGVLMLPADTCSWGTGTLTNALVRIQAWK